MKTVLIIGVDQFGSHIAKRMEELRCEVMAVDENEEMFVSLPSAACFSPLWKQRLCSRSWGQRKSYPVRQMMYK